MRQTLWTFLFIAGSFLCLAVYYLALTDWVQTIITSLYEGNSWNAVLITLPIVLYLFLGVRFIANKLKFLLTTR